MKKYLHLPLLLIICSLARGQASLDYYLPDEISYNPAIPTPEQFFGYEIGEWHLTHDKLYYYMLKLAESSNRATWEEYARSYENRPLGQLIISSPENIKNLETIRKQHVDLSDPSISDGLDISKMPVFIKLGYGIHGNETSGPNASALVAYYLVAAEGKEIDELLDNAVILVDPSLNPDGMQRFSTWVNSAKSLNNNPDPGSWEFTEPWPGGRTNHYWFDLNRDYIMLQHPESVGRVEAFYRWRPNINTDHHEMGANSTFFFQPGVQSRTNPLIPAENQELTKEIGKYHEKYLDKIGSLYYSEEGYDDFYVGKGSSYPDIHGSVGILFEQAGVRGHLRETPSGMLSFPFAIRNQVTVSLSSLEAGLKMREELLDNQRNFYKDALTEADKYPVKAFIFSDPSDKERVTAFIDNLLQHHIKIYKPLKDVTRNGITYRKDDSYLVPLKQPEYRFIRCLFEPVTEFTDSIFYDVSTWVLPMSFNIPYSAIEESKILNGLVGTELDEPPSINGNLLADRDAYAYLFEWKEYYTPKALYQVQDAGIIARVATDEFVCEAAGSVKKFDRGTILIPAYNQNLTRNEIFNLMQKVAQDCGIAIYGVKTGLTPQGIDLGSSGFNVLKKPSIMVIIGDGNSSTDIGEMWHLLDRRFNIPLTMVQASRFRSVDPGRYNVIIIAGNPEIGSSGLEKIRLWNRDGGTIIGYESGNNWLVRNKLADIEFIARTQNKKKESIYSNREGDRQAQIIPGSIFETELDLSHPLCYGYTRSVLPVFKSTTSVANKNSDIYNNPVTYSGHPLLSGYCSDENIDRIKGSAFASIHNNRIISIYDNTNFRAIWYGTTKIFMNAIFFGQLMGTRTSFDTGD
jgi:hypothetical protein